MEQVLVHNVPKDTQDSIMSPFYTMAQVPVHNAFKDTHAVQYEQCSLQFETDNLGQFETDNLGQRETAIVVEDTDNKTPVKCTCQAPADCTCFASEIPTDYYGSPSEKLQKIEGDSDNVVPPVKSKLAGDCLKPTTET